MRIRRRAGWRGLAVAFVAASLACVAGPARADGSPFLDGYASATSAAPGETLGVHVSTLLPTVTVRVVRFGATTDVIAQFPGLPGDSYPVPDSASALGCGWPTLVTVTIPAEWRSGMYAFQLVTPNGSVNTSIPFVVRGDPAARNPVLLLQAVNTYEAYNAYGGQSLYDFNSMGGRLPRVSFDRPYDGRRGLGQPQFEQPFVHWFEGAGFAADYATDVDLALDPDLLVGRRLLVVLGHSEYWSRSMVDAVTAFVDTAGNLASFSGNTCFWNVRYENAGRTLVCYKSDDDPMFATNPESTTVLFRDWEVGLPEEGLFGVEYPLCEERTADSLLFKQPYGWITAGLEAEVGHRFGRNDVGYEYDTAYSGFANDGAIHLFETPSTSTTCFEQQVSTYYERQPQFGYAEQGGGIFAAGTVQWSWGLDGSSSGQDPDPRLQRLTANLLRGLGQRLAVPESCVAIVRAVLGDAGPPADTGFTVQAAEFGPAAETYDPAPLADDGVWPDSAAGDGVWTGLLPLPAGRRLPLKLAWREGGVDLCAASGDDWLWLSDLTRADSVYTRFVDTLHVCNPLVAVPPGTPVWRPLRAAPNPFTAAVRLAWDASLRVRGITILDLRGRVVATPAVAAGAGAITWDGRGADGRALPAGVYWARVTTPVGSRSLRVVKLR